MRASASSEGPTFNSFLGANRCGQLSRWAFRKRRHGRSRDRQCISALMAMFPVGHYRDRRRRGDAASAETRLAGKRCMRAFTL